MNASSRSLTFYKISLHVTFFSPPLETKIIEPFATDYLRALPPTASNNYGVRSIMHHTIRLWMARQVQVRLKNDAAKFC